MPRRNVAQNADDANAFVQACLGLKAARVPNQPYSWYDYFAFWHYNAMNAPTPAGNLVRRNAAHGGPAFGPWHRLLLWAFEEFSKQVLGDSDFQVPYWDWSADAGDPSNSAVWNVVGGDGDPNRNDEVVDGPFREGGFAVLVTDRLDGQIRLLEPPMPLRRNFGALSGSQLADNDMVNTVVGGYAGEYDRAPFHNLMTGSTFRLDLEVPLHNAVHRFVGGDMMTSASPNDPVFWLHHCNIDRIWASWQARNPGVYQPGPNESNQLRFHRSGDPMHNYLNISASISDILTLHDYDVLV